MPAQDTKQRILDAAEQLFADAGFEPSSLRAVTKLAGVNLAAIHYHFGGKAALLQAVIERRVGTINAERLRMLDAAQAAGTPDVQTVLEAFLAPPLRLAGQGDPGLTHFMRLMGRLRSGEGRRRRGVVRRRSG